MNIIQRRKRSCVLVVFWFVSACISCLSACRQGENLSQMLQPCFPSPFPHPTSSSDISTYEYSFLKRHRRNILDQRYFSLPSGKYDEASQYPFVSSKFLLRRRKIKEIQSIFYPFITLYWLTLCQILRRLQSFFWSINIQYF